MITAFLGCGKIAEYHLEGIKKYQHHIETLLLFDINITAAEDLAKKWKGKAVVYNSIDDLFSDHSPDVVHVLTPTQYHFPCTKTALLSGADVIVEKPFMQTTKEAEKIINLAEEKNARIQVDFSLLYMPVTKEAKKCIESGDFGKLVGIQIYYGHDEGGKIPYQDPNHWAYKFQEGILRNLLSHPLSVVIDLLGNVNKSYAMVKKNIFLPGENSDTFQCILDNSIGIASIQVTMASRNKARYCRIICEDGIIEIDFSRQLLILHKNGSLNAIKKITTAFNIGKQYRKKTIKNILNIIRGKLRSNPGLLNFVEEFYRSREESIESFFDNNKILEISKLEEKLLNGSSKHRR